MAYEIGYTQVAAEEGTVRKNGLTRLIVSARVRRTSVQPDQLSLAKIREALVSGVTVEEFETASTSGRFVRWLERTCRKTVKHASDQADTTASYGRGRLFAAGK
jgi:hypothetical protein